jgi:hypothetical protein
MVDEPAPHHGHRLEAAVRVAGKTRHLLPVVHPPTVGVLKILANGMAGQRSRRPKAAVGLGIGIVVVDTKQEGIEGDPGKAQGQNFENGAVHQKLLFDHHGQSSRCFLARWTRLKSALSGGTLHERNMMDIQTKRRRLR